MEKICACKGCRSCLLCEPSKSNVVKTNEFFVFYYLHQLHQAVALPEVSHCINKNNDGIINLVGFNFPGVEIIPNFISPEEEKALINEIDSISWKESQSGRRKQDYGPKVNFKKQKVKFATFNGLPSYINPIIMRMNNLPYLKDFKVVEQCNLDYSSERGSHIDSHFDDDWLWGEHLVTLNLLSDTWFTMTYPESELLNLKDISIKGINNELLDKMKSQSFSPSDLTSEKVKVKIPMQQRSLIILKGSARYKWKHAIERSDIASRRVCCTFRELSHIFRNNEREKEIGNRLLSIASSFKGSVVL